MRLLNPFCLILISFLLVACIKHQASPEQAACLLKCQDSLQLCEKTCYNSCKECAACSMESTEQRYARYRKQQCVQGAMISRELQSYRDPLKCLKATCECKADYNICKQSCFGRIEKRLQVAPYCC